MSTSTASCWLPPTRTFWRSSACSDEDAHLRWGFGVFDWLSGAPKSQLYKFYNSTVQLLGRMVGRHWERDSPKASGWGLRAAAYRGGGHKSGSCLGAMDGTGGGKCKDGMFEHLTLTLTRRPWRQAAMDKVAEIDKNSGPLPRGRSLARGGGGSVPEAPVWWRCWTRLLEARAAPVDPRVMRSLVSDTRRERKAKWGTAPGRGLPRAPGPVKHS